MRKPSKGEIIFGVFFVLVFGFLTWINIAIIQGYPIFGF